VADLQALSASDVDPTLPPSGLDHFDLLLNQLRDELGGLLDLSGVHYNDINSSSSGFVVMGWNPWRWNKLPAEAAPRVGAARKVLRTLNDFASNAVRHAPDQLKELKELEEAFEGLIEQPDNSRGASKSTIELAREYVSELAAKYQEIIRGLPSAFGSGEKLLIADTSVLLDRPDLQDWTVDGSAWTVLLLPQALSELDDHKRDPRTRDAAQKVINQIEEFDRRGDPFEGVPLAGKVSVREVATSPDMNHTLSWLRADVPDDALIAGALELSWEDLTSRIVIAASDRNVRNKARLAGFGSRRASDL
jgi:PIN domain